VDHALENSVGNEALKRFSEIDSRGIWVEIDSSKLILYGHAQSERRMLEHVAWPAPVIPVTENNIEITR
jgi:hypothetical protein